MKRSPISILICAFVLMLGVFDSSTVSARDPVKPLLNDNGLAQTPPMGWNSWNIFRCDIDETKIRTMADAMVARGMKAVGYEYVIIDDCWQVGRAADGTILADPQRFPSGMKALADYVHSKGLKFGLYSDAGIATCEGRPGSRGYEYQDARTYAAWGVDYLKYDWCNSATQDARSSYLLMSDALQKTGRPIVFSICEWGANKPWDWARASGGNLWRTKGDIWDHWEKGREDWQQSVMSILDAQLNLYPYAGPGGWNDPDMLVIGNGGMTDTEYRTHFSLWAMLAAPLIAGNDLEHMSTATQEILTNKDIIDVDQDRLGIQGRRVLKQDKIEIWARPLADGGRAVILLNRDENAQSITVKWENIGYSKQARLTIKNLWSHRVEGTFRAAYTATVPAHGVVMIKLY